MAEWELVCTINDQRKVYRFRTRAQAREQARIFRAWEWRTSVRKVGPAELTEEERARLTRPPRPAVVI